MTRVALYGGAELRSAAEVLGLEVVVGRPQIVIVDLRDLPTDVHVSGIDAPIDVPRIVIADEARRPMARAFGYPDSAIAATAEPAVLGPLVRAATPRPERAPTRLVAVTAARGGVGRTLLVDNLARRLAGDRIVVVIDATGTGMSGWWLGVSPRPWHELEGLAAELTADHLTLVMTEATCGARVLGGSCGPPSVALVTAAARAALGHGGIVLVDLPLIADERSVALVDLADRTLVVTYGDDASLAALDAAELPRGSWLISSQSVSGGIALHEVFHALPRDEDAIARALAGRASVGGRLGAAYDALARIIIEDAS